MKRFATATSDVADESELHDLPRALPKRSALIGVFARTGIGVRLSRHQQLTLPADAADCAYLVQSGTIAIETATAHRQIIDFGYAGELLDVSLLPAVPCLRLHAIEACELWRLRQKGHKPPFAELPDVLRDYQLLASAMVKRLVLANIMLGSLTGEQRVASFLVSSVMRQGRVASNSCTLRMPMLRADIADYLSLNPDTLSRITSDLQERGLLVTQGRHHVLILDWRGLCGRTPLSAAILHL